MVWTEALIVFTGVNHTGHPTGTRCKARLADKRLSELIPVCEHNKELLIEITMLNKKYTKRKPHPSCLYALAAGCSFSSPFNNMGSTASDHSKVPHYTIPKDDIGARGRLIRQDVSEITGEAIQRKNGFIP